MVERRENLSLLEEPLMPALIAATPWRENLERYFLSVLIVSTLRQVDGAHPATRDLAQDTVRAELRVRAMDRGIRASDGVIQQRGYEAHGGRLQGRRAGRGIHDRPQLRAGGGMFEGIALEKSLPLGGRHFEHTVRCGENLPPECGLVRFR
jgi:hypothetical protein